MAWNYRTFLLIAVLALWCHPAQAQLDAYGGSMNLTCPNTTGVFTLDKVGNRWYFCTPLGHVFFANQTQPLESAQNACQTNTFNSTGAPLNWTVYSGSVYQATINWTVNSVYEGGPLSGTLYAKQNAIPTAAKQWFQNGNTLYVWTSTGASPATLTMGFPDNYSTIVTAKYGDTTYNYTWQNEKRLQNWGFNSIGQDAGTTFSPTYTCNGCVWPGGKNPLPMPYIAEDRPSSYATINLNNYEANGPVHNTMSSTNGNYTAYRSTLVDAFDPKLSDWTQQDFAKNSGWANLRANSPWLLGMYIDDSDYFRGSGCGPDYTCGGGGNQNANPAWITMISAPVVTMANSTQNRSVADILYPDTRNYSKTQATNPAHGTCSTNAPCSLRDFLYDKYSGSIGSLNAAWGSNYKQFDSTGTQVTGEVIGSAGSANCSTTTTTVCTYTLTHAPVSPLSVQVFVGGSFVIGDCPWFENWPLNSHGGCGQQGTSSSAGPSLAVNTGSLGSPTSGYINQLTSTINYTTGQITINFGSALSAGTAITASYECCGWMAGGTGLTDENGANAWVGTNPLCLEGPDPNYPTYYACIGGSGNQALPSLSVNVQSISCATNCTVTAVRSLPAPFTSGISVYINGTSGACDVGPVTISSVTSNSFQIPATGCGSSAAGVVNTAVGVDLDNWVKQASAEYFKTFRDDLANPNSYGYAGSKIPFLGLDTIGSWYAPAYSKFLQGAGNADNPSQPYIKMAFISFRSDLPSLAAATNSYQYITRYLGDVPIGNFETPEAQSDSSMACLPNSGYGMLSTQLQAGQTYYNSANFLMNTLSYNGDYPFVMQDHWAYQDFQNASQGLVSAHDNAYDGVEALSGTQACETSYYSVNSGTTCGKEAANFGNLITGANGIQAANALWLSIISPNAPNSQFKNNGNKGKVHQ